jgi:hypothetical protein
MAELHRAEPQPWEYRHLLVERVEVSGRWKWAIHGHHYDSLQDAIKGYVNGLGKDGWELISVVAMSPLRDHGLWFRRPLV